MYVHIAFRAASIYGMDSLGGCIAPEVVPDVLANKAVFLPKNIFFHHFQHRVLSLVIPLERVPKIFESFIKMMIYSKLCLLRFLLMMQKTAFDQWIAGPSLFS
jgi:hypothetical protein